MLYTADYKKYGAVSQTTSVGFATSLIVARTFVERRLLRGADWRAQLDRAWEDCKSGNS